MSGRYMKFKRQDRLADAKLSSSAHTVADLAKPQVLGSDPHSVEQSSQGLQRLAEWGSDPNFAGHGTNCFPAELPDRRPQPSKSIFGVALAVARRIGVRAQFGDAPATMDAMRGRIGIRPQDLGFCQICYRAWCTGGVEKLPIHSRARETCPSAPHIGVRDICGFVPHIGERWAA